MNGAMLGGAEGKTKQQNEHATLVVPSIFGFCFK
jgi:hypothetical protein